MPQDMDETTRKLSQLQREVRALRTLIERMLLDNEQERRDGLITTGEFAKLHGITTQTVVNRIKRGIYGGVQIGKMWYLKNN